jgi:hypothetical protein
MDTANTLIANDEAGAQLCAAVALWASRSDRRRPHAKLGTKFALSAPFSLKKIENFI